MEEEAPSRRSVAELAGRFKGSAPPHDAAGNETDKPVRRRPPCSLQLPKTHGDDQEQSPGVTSPLPAKTKRNSALIEKLQASLSLSPSGPIPSPKSPGFRLLPPAFPPASPSSAPVTAVTTSSTVTPTSPVTASPVTEEEGPASFEDPPTLAEGSILLSMNKSRARHSLRRRPPSRRHRKSSSGDEVGVTNDVADKATAGGGGGEKEEAAGEVFKKEGTTDEMKDDKTDASTCPGEDQHETESREEDEKRKEGENGPMGGEEGDRSSSGGKEEEEKQNQAEDVSEGATNTESREEEKSAVIPT
ncbi:duboraya isoform X2 [Seriola aureovittata]|uniref:duboraya isoform X2 n=1 Tax=Seriola aureovittata TaxID=2871759 RepID=UPI0024BEBF36|nr:duboraya isoform X2 [Seriola aureovittata]